ncbi:trichohyalin-like isoform X1 [Stylophora pistillata]|uniref:trichohyalin-like isoform X1 n=1 Tax=Stylophora pistillata TaxID=50429 RepID=UPI000C045E58|nr:trichohyalin-like isoform X1 [Stylophora pistillata]
MNALHHPRIIRLYDAFEEPRQIILILEYCRGGDLFNRIDDDSLPEFEAVKILKQVLEAVKYMHGLGFMHLDLKPQNVMFKSEGGSKIKLIDFSLTKKFDPDQETKISFGTAEYVAPEIVNYEPVTLAADMWAIGVIAYIMLSGESPFLCESEADTFSRITDARWEFTDVFDYVSKEAKDFIKRLLLKDPRKRMTVDECLGHEWIKSPGFTGKRKSKISSEGELTIDQNSNITSPTELMRQESGKSEQELPLDPRKLESKVKSLLSKLQNAEKENQELEEKLRDEEDRADVLEDELHTSENSRKVLEDRVSKLEAEKTDLSKKAKANSDVLKRVAESEGDKRALEDKLSEQTRYLETLSRKYDTLKEKIENYDILEEKAYLLERERKDLRDAKQSLEDKIGHLQAEKEELTKMNEKNSLINRDLDNEIAKLKTDRDEIENQYVKLRTEKESLVEELTKRFNILDEQKRSLGQEKSNLETKLGAFESENKNLKLKLDGLTKEMESLKEISKNNEQDKEKDELEKELTKVKMHNDEAKKTCEELASKLNKAYAELEQLKPAKMDSASENHQEEISALTEKLSYLEEERDNLEDDLDEREAEIVELKEKIELLEAENKDRSKDIINYKSQLEAANEEIKSWRMRKDGTSSAAPKGDEESLNEKMKDYESMMSKLMKEISALQEKLSAADQLNKKLEEKVKSSVQASLPDPNMVSEIIGRSENTLEYSSMDFDYLDGLSGDRNDRNEEISVKGRINDDLNKEGESERFVMLKREFEKVRRMSEDAETRLAEEIQKNQTLEDELEDFEIKEENGLRMYRELEEECNRLRAQLTDSESWQKQVEIRLRENLKRNEEKTEALSKQVDSLKKQLHVIKEERDKGDKLYTNLSEKYRNLLKEKKILEREKNERDESETKSRELEDSLQTRILELTNMKDEIESMRDNLRSLVREKDEGMKEFSLLQKDLVKATNDRQQLEEQVKDEIFRAEKLERDRFILQGKIEEMQKNLNKRDLVDAANKKAIDAYVDEIRLLKDEKGEAFKEVDKLRKESKNLMHDLEKITKEREDVESLKIFKEHAMKEIKTLKDENQRLLQKSEDFDQITVDLNTLREEKVIGLQHLGTLEEERENALREIAILKSENHLLLEKTNQFEEIKEAFESLKGNAEILRENIEALKLEKEASEKAVEDLRKENNLHLEKVEECDKMKEDLETLREEKVIGLKELSSLTERNASLLEEVKAMDELKRECDFLKSKNEKALEENRILTELNESLVKDQEGAQRISLELKKAEDERERISKENRVLAEKCDTLKKKIEELTLLNDGQLIELGRLNQELDDSEKENEALVAKLESFHVVKKDFSASLESNQRLQKESRDLEVNLETQALEVMRLKKETTVLKKKNDALTKEIERLQGKNAILETQTSITLLEEGEESEQIYEPKTSDTKGIRRKLDELMTFEEIANNYSVEVEKPENVKLSKINKCNEAQALKEEVNFLQKEVEDLSEDHKELLQSYNTLQKEYDHLKEEFGVLEKSLEIKSREMKSMTEVRDLLENTKNELENELKATSKEKTQVSKELETVKGNCDSQKLRLEIAEKEIGNLSKENEELHQNHIELEERCGRIRKLNRELEEDIDIETGKLVEARERISELKKENALLQQRHLMLLHEIDKLKGIPELSGQEQGGVAKKIKSIEKKISVTQMQKGDQEIRPPEEMNKGKKTTEKNKAKVSGDEARKPEGCAENVKEEKRTQQNQEERTVWALEREIKNLRPQKERAEALAKELDQVKQRLDNEITIRKSKTEESSQKKKENDLLIYELESTRHRIVSNVISLLEEAKLPWKFSVTAADISAGKSKAWSSIKESIGTLIWERERMVNENALLQQENSKLKRECQEPRKGKEKIKQFEELVGKELTDEDILSKQQEIKALHETIASDKDNLTQLQQQQKDLLLKIEFMQRMQSTADQERDQLVARKSLFTSDGRPGLNAQSRFKLRRFQSVESISILKERDIFEEKQDPVDFPTQTHRITTQWSGNKGREGSTGEEQLQVAREMVKKNRRIFELEQEVDVLLTKMVESSSGNAAGEKFSSDAENFRLEILRLEGENKRLKELAKEPIPASSQKKNGIIRSHKQLSKKRKRRTHSRNFCQE